ncbi:MAG: tyrosine-type recombinase/integrase [Lachnospiraceae bacterium]|nr:tyrosine-type recombinase/integrase [Lachnospiraceae bacterium]MDE6699101.1 tyrosine-type recombinase/integrase [Lachnospiraceae bacterium]
MMPLKADMASFTAATFTLRSPRMTANIMRSILCQSPRKSLTVTSQSLLCVCDLMAHLNRRAQWEPCAERSEKKVEDLENFHFHMLRHTFTSNLLSGGAAPKDVQELLGHSDVSTTMNIYAHASREAKRTSARLLDKVVGE